MCLTVEIDEKQFPDAASFFDRLNNHKILFVTNRQLKEHLNNPNVCYKIEIDSEKSLQIIGTVLAELIKHNYLTKYAESIIKTDYISVNINDRADVINNILQFTDIVGISELICEYIKSNRHMHLGGFVLFRMKDFLRSFEDEIDFAVDEYIEMQRHKDFVRFLRFFVSIQESEFDEINLVLLKNQKYYLLDGNGVPISKNLLDSTHCEISTLEDNSSYLMINDLVALAPKHIILHCNKDDIYSDVPSLIKEVFYGRVSVCHSCKFCKNKYKF